MVAERLLETLAIILLGVAEDRLGEAAGWSRFLGSSLAVESIVARVLLPIELVLPISDC